MARVILDTVVRRLQGLWGPTVTAQVQSVLGPSGTRVARELLGRTARHRVQLRCPTEVVGRGNDAWVVCPARLGKGAIVYSLGVGNEVGFDLDLIARYGVEVFAFDPSPGAIAFVKSRAFPPAFHFIEHGVADFDGFATFYHHGGKQYGLDDLGDRASPTPLPVKRLSTAMNSLHHEAIDLLKINIEGGEYRVLHDMLVSKVPVRQLVVEFHHRLPGFELGQTVRAVRELNDAGYRIFHIAENGKEYSFIRVP